MTPLAAPSRKEQDTGACRRALCHRSQAVTWVTPNAKAEDVEAGSCRRFARAAKANFRPASACSWPTESCLSGSPCFGDGRRRGPQATRRPARTAEPVIFARVRGGDRHCRVAAFSRAWRIRRGVCPPSHRCRDPTDAHGRGSEEARRRFGRPLQKAACCNRRAQTRRDRDQAHCRCRPGGAERRRAAAGERAVRRPIGPHPTHQRARRRRAARADAPLLPRRRPRDRELRGHGG